MGNVVLSLSVSLDGRFEGPDGDISWHRVDEELHGHLNQALRGMRAVGGGTVALRYARCRR